MPNIALSVMEAEERPRKLRKTSHGSNEGEIEITAPHDQNGAEDDGSKDTETVTDTHEPEDEDAIQIETKPPEQEVPRGQNHDRHDEVTEAQQSPSKNQQKKAKRKAEWEAGREDRKLKRREKAKEKKERRRTAREEERQAEKDAKQIAHGRQPVPPRPPRHYLLPISFVIDCGFDSLMHEREIISLGSQITRAYSDNTRAQYQAHLYVSGWEPTTELRKRFDGLLKGVHANWRGIKFIQHDFVEAAAQARMDMASKHGGRMLGAFQKYQFSIKPANGHAGPAFAPAGVTEEEEEPAEFQRAERKAGAEEQEADAFISSTDDLPSPKDLQDQAEVTYLTSDSPYTLSELKPYHTYIIGGIVDKNRHKGICYKTALDANGKPKTRAMLSGKKVKTAKLPIGDYMSMLSRQVLATNHVVEIMLKWLECGDWGQAFVEVMPKRKGAKLKNGNTLVEEQEQATQGASNDEEAHESPGSAPDIHCENKAQENGSNAVEQITDVGAE